MLLAATDYDSLSFFAELPGISSCLDTTVCDVQVLGYRRKSGSGRLFFIPFGASAPISLDLNAAIFPMAIRAISALSGN